MQMSAPKQILCFERIQKRTAPYQRTLPNNFHQGLAFISLLVEIPDIPGGKWLRKRNAYSMLFRSSARWYEKDRNASFT